MRTRFLAVSFFTATLPLLYPQDTPAVPATSPSPELPAALKNLEGLWVGTALHQSESAEIAYEFGLYKGKLLAKEWLPKLHVFGAPVGYVAEKATGFTIPGLDLDFSIEDDHLIGEFGLTELPIRLERSNRALPTETVPPASESIPKIAWSYQAPGGIWANPVAAGSTVVVGDSGGHLQALDGTNGQRRWLFDAQSPLHGEPAVAGDAVYFLADNGRLFKVTLSSGKLIWKADLGGGGKRSLPGSPDGWDYSSAGPVVADGKIYIGGGDGTFHALDAENGKEIWKFKAGDKVRATALVTGNRVFFGSFDHYIYGLDRETGKQVWRFDTGSAVNTAPVLAEHKIVVGTRDKSLLYALDMADGRPTWIVFHWLSWVESTPRFVDGMLYVGSSDYRSVRALRPDNGSLVWDTDVFGWSYGTPLVLEKTVYYATAGTPNYMIKQIPSLGALDRKTGALKWRHELPYSKEGFMSGYANSLAYANGNIIAAGVNGTITAFRPPE